MGFFERAGLSLASERVEIRCWRARQHPQGGEPSTSFEQANTSHEIDLRLDAVHARCRRAFVTFVRSCKVARVSCETSDDERVTIA